MVGSKKLLFGLLTILLVVTSVVAVLTFQYHESMDHHPLVLWAIQNHLMIMIVLVVISVAFGFVWSYLLYGELQKQKKSSRNLLEVIFLFLSAEERQIIDFLMKNQGPASQADISRLPGLDRVKAFRSLQRMQQKNLVEIIPHGKVRKVILRQHIIEMVNDDVK